MPETSGRYKWDNSPLNRDQRRKAWKKMKSDPRALDCPECWHKTLWVADHADDVDHYNVYCTVCGGLRGRVREGQRGVTESGVIDGKKWDERT